MKLLISVTALLFVAVTHASTTDKHNHTYAGKPTVSLAQSCAAPFALPTAECAVAPMPIFGPGGQLWLSYVSHGHVYLSNSEDLGKSFSPPMLVNRVPEKIYADKENRPKLAFGQDGELFVSWTRKRKAKYSGEIRFSRSLDGGESFEATRSLIDEGALSSHRFDSMAVDDEGRLYVTWIDKRDKAAAESKGEDYAGGSVYYSVSEDGGATFSQNKKIIDNSCECCRLKAQSDDQGRVHVLWRNIYPGSARDNAMAVLDNGEVVKAATRVTNDDWKIEACPHHGPDIALDKQSRLHAVWFNGGGKRPGLAYGRFDSTNDSLEHDISIDGSPAASHPRVYSEDNRVYLVWKRLVGDETEIRLIESHDAGATWSEYKVVATTLGESDQAFLLGDGKQIYLSWRTDEEGYRLIALSSTQIAKLDD